VGRIVEQLRAVDDGRETIVLFSSDHGDFLGEHGFAHKGSYLLDQLLRVPMLATPLGGDLGANAGRTLTGLTSAVDILPTCLALAGAPQHACSGRSFLAADCTPFPHGAHENILAEWEGDQKGPEHSQRCLRTDTHKLITYADDQVGEIYDVAADPLEFYNRWSDPAYAAIKGELQDCLATCYPDPRPVLAKECGW